MKTAKNLGAALLLVVLIIIVLQNTESVETRILFATLEMPRALLLFSTLVVGVILGLIGGSRLPGFGKSQS